ncbi:MAG: EscU/YscU/HrcU family type III secretion system export apparatus switch protein [Planctomycetales bacterium]|nr:EscU/YscU/HrcU family type III secretion system export apparatus switch protein [Planctomycetales bacterium]
MHDRTEIPTPRRRRDARSRGEVARSRDLTWAVLLLAVSGGLRWFSGDLASDLAVVMRSSLSEPATTQIDAHDVSHRVWQMAGLLSRSLLPLLMVAMLTAAAVNLAQVGFLFARGAVAPTAARVSPLAGLRRLFAGDHFVRNLIGLLKLATLVTVATAFIWRQLPGWMAMGDVGSLATSWGDTFVGLALRLSCVLLVISVLDYVYEWRRYERGLRMTKQEVRDEQRQQEADPHARRQLRDSQRERLRGQP